ncbi:MAG: beta-propeller fold lactonase family protein [bacterium]|nr:beta-propeller fold lactonase family protein [bacterium]
MGKCVFVALLFLMVVLSQQDLRAETSVYWMADGPMGADLNNDGIVGFTDFLIFLRSFGTQQGDENHNPLTDFDGNGATNFSDFTFFGTHYGTSQPQTQSPSPTETYSIYIADSDDSSVMVLISESHLVIDYLPFRGPTGITISPNQQEIYVSEGFGFFSITPLHTVVFSVPVGSRGKSVLSPDGTRAYVTDESDDLIRVVDVVNGVTLDSVLVGNRPIDIDITPDGRKLYVVNQTDRNIAVIDVGSLTAYHHIPIGAIPGEIEITPDGTRAFVTNLNRGVIDVIDTASDLIVGAIQLDQELAFGAEFSPDGQTLYVSADGFLLAIDARRNLILRSMRIADDSTILGLTPDGKRAYVTTFSQLAGGPSVTVVDLNAWKILGLIRGVLFPRQIAFRKLPPTSGDAP